MALPVNSIGVYTVRNWIGQSPPPVVQRRTEVLNYPGVDYEAVRVHEIRSGVFSLDSITDAANMTAANARLEDYRDLIGNGPQRIIWNDIDYDDYGVRALVLRVTPITIKRRALICGALNSGNDVDLAVRWELVWGEYP